MSGSLAFPRIFFACVLGYYACVAALNVVVDPFFQLTEWKTSFAEKAVSRPFNEILLKAGAYRDSGATRIVTGDSRAFPFTAERFAAHGSNGWFPFGIGGGHVREVVDAVHFAAALGELEQVVLVMPMRMFVERQGNRFPEALDLASRPMLYLTNSLVTKASLANLYFHATGGIVKTQKQEGSKADAWAYWLRHAALQAEVWQAARVPTRELLTGLFDWLRSQGIAFTILMPPIHDDLRAVYQDRLAADYADYLQFFRALPETLDCTDTARSADYDQFRDPYHFDEGIAEILVADLLAGGGEICRRGRGRSAQAPP